QPATLLVAIGTLVLTVLLYWYVPKGFFPVEDTGVIQTVSEAPQNISFAAMALRQQALVRVILQDPAVESLSSFIGVDGTNTTVNSGRILVNLKPLTERKAGVAEIIQRLQRQLVEKLATIPALRDIATDQQNEGLGIHLVIDRATASRLGITASMIDASL